jgi:hypothetical protein
MVNYDESKIYRIVCNTTGLVYYGSTVKILSGRLAGHCYNYRKYLEGNDHYYTSFEVLENDNYEIVLVENYPCDTKEELHARERFYIENNECVNKTIPTRTPAEYREEHKEIINERGKIYRESHKEEIAKINKKYNEENKEKIKQKGIVYREANREAINAKKKEYAVANKETILAQRAKYREENREKLRAQKKIFIEANRERVNAKKREHYHNNKERINAENKAKRQANK